MGYRSLEMWLLSSSSSISATYFDLFTDHLRPSHPLQPQVGKELRFRGLDTWTRMISTCCTSCSHTCCHNQYNHYQYQTDVVGLTMTRATSNSGSFVLLQEQPKGPGKAIGYCWWSLNGDEQANGTMDRDFLSVLWTMKLSRPCLEEWWITNFADHDVLWRVLNMIEATEKQAPGRLRRSEFNFEVVHWAWSHPLGGYHKSGSGCAILFSHNQRSQVSHGRWCTHTDNNVLAG